jgi:zinc protease
LLSSVMSIRAKEVLREKLGASYSPSANSTTSDDFKGYGYLSLEATVLPKDVKLVTETIDSIARDMITTPPTVDEIKRAGTPMLASFDQLLRNNGYWISVVDEAQTDIGDLDEVRRYKSILESLTSRDLQTLAKQYLQPQKALRVQILAKPSAQAPKP